MLLKRILRYGIVFLCILLVISLICLYQHRAFLASYFSDSFSSAVGVGLYLLIYALAIGMLLRAIVR